MKITAFAIGAVLLCTTCATTNDDTDIRPISLRRISTHGSGQQIPADTLLLAGKLDNGMEYYIQENLIPMSKGYATFGLIQKTGSIHESDEEQGLSHFLEHMLFNGTRHFPDNSIIQYANSIGVRFGNDLNAFTNFDNVRYILPNVNVEGNDERVDSCLLVLRDWACDATIADEKFDDERTIVLREYAMHDTGESDEIAGIFPNTPHAIRTPVGKKEAIDKMTPEQMRNFYKKWYQPQNQAIIIVSSLDRYKVLERVEHFFGDIPKGTTTIPSPVLDLSPRKEPDVTIYTNKKKANAIINICYNRPSETDRSKVNSVEKHIESKIENAFVKFLKARLNNIQRNMPAMVSNEVFAGHFSEINEINSLAIHAECVPQIWNEVLTEILSELVRIQRFGWLKNEMTDNNGEISGDGKLTEECEFYDQHHPCQSNADNASIFNGLINQSLNGTPVTISSTGCFLDRYTDKHVSQEMIYSHICNIIENSRLSISISLPEDADMPKSETVKGIYRQTLKTDFSKSKYANANLPISALIRNANISPNDGRIISQEIINDGVFYENREYRDSLRAIRLETADKSSIVPFSTIHTDETTKFVLSNGITVTTIEKHAYPYRVKGFKNGGLSIFDDDEARIASLHKYAIRDIAPNIETNGINGEMTIEPDMCMMDFRLAQKDMSTNLPDASQIDDFFKYIHIKLTNSEVDEKKFNNYMQTLRFKKDDEAPTIDRFNEYEKNLILNSNEASMPLTANEIDSCTIEKVARLYRKITSNYNGTEILIESSLTAEELAPYIEKYIATLPSEEEPQKTIDRKRLHFKETNASASYVIDSQSPIAYKQIDFTQEKNFEYTLSNLLNIEAVRYIASRLLYQRLRDEHKYVYSTSEWSQAEHAPFPRFVINIFTSCEPKNSGIVSKIIKKTMNDMAYGNAVSVELINEYKTDKRLMKNNTSSQFIDEELERRRNGNINTNLNDLEAIENVSVEGVRTFVKSLLENGNVFDFEMTTRE